MKSLHDFLESASEFEIPLPDWRANAIANFKEFLKQPNYPCVAAISALTSNAIRFGAYEDFPSRSAAKMLADDLYLYLQEQLQTKHPYLSLAALFRNFAFEDEISFEQDLWQQLEYIHEFDLAEWDERVNSNPEDPKFCFSFMGHGFFVVGMHPNSSRESRRTEYPALVFNLYQQFEDLKPDGRYESMKVINRARDMKFQGSENPMLTKYGEDTEALQYSGRAVEKDWKCPFKFKE